VVGYWPQGQGFDDLPLRSTKVGAENDPRSLVD